ncbi:MAG: fumarylacetoacetate hydrolase family protein [Lysobacter sp.]|nr:fumarylacetoacetate hydrolase family protein [Lysobacter sp.]MDQ3206365.1 fumarylacetoacetate hydrolase family protein [Pseudomonadota bacterium]
MTDVIAAQPPTRLAVRDAAATVARTFPVHRIYCVGRNFVEHAREMGAAPASGADRGQPVFFCKPADALVRNGLVPYPRGTRELHHEVELVVAIGRDAPAGVLPAAEAESLVFGYGVGLDLTRRDLQAAAKACGMPWDTSKAFDHSAPVSELVPATEIGELGNRTLTLQVNGRIRQHAELGDMVWSVPEILHELSKLYALRAGDLVFMGTPAGVGPLLPGDRYVAQLDGVVGMSGKVGAREPACETAGSVPG